MYNGKLSELDPLKLIRRDFISERAHRAYTKAVCRPDIAYSFAQLAQYTGRSDNKCRKTTRQYRFANIRNIEG